MLDELVGGTVIVVVTVFVMRGPQVLLPLPFLTCLGLSSTGAAAASPPRRRMPDENNDKVLV